MNSKFHLHVAADHKEANLSNTASPQIGIKRARLLAVTQGKVGGERQGEITRSQPKLKRLIWGKANCRDML